MREPVDRGGARHPLVELTRVRILEFFREPEAVFWVFVFPILMAFALGIAFRSSSPQPVYVGVERGEGADALLAALEGAAGVHARAIAPAEVERALRNGVIQIVVVPGSPPTYRYDPTRTESRLARFAVDDALQRAAGRNDSMRARDEEVVAVGSRYIDWLIPGLLGMNIMGTGLWGIGFSVVQARTRKLLKRLMATPMRRGQYLLSHMLGRLVFLGMEVAALLGFGWVVFRVPVRGSFVALVALTLLGALSFGGMGLLIASRARTVEAVSGLMNIVMLPMWILSGVFFSSANFPEVMQPFIRALPLTALNEALRAVMIDGEAISAVLRQIALLVAWGGASFLVALRVFRWR